MFYDGGPFLGYLDRCNWAKADFWSPDKTTNDVHSILQAWIFFGLLAEVLGSDYDQRAFVVQKLNDSMCLSTSHLAALLESSIKRERSLDAKIRQAHDFNLAACVEAISDTMSAVIARTDHMKISPGPLLHLSFMALVEHLVMAAPLIYGPWFADLGEEEQHPAKIAFKATQPLGYLLNRMAADGWCPCHVEQWQSTSISELYFIASLDRPAPGKQHANCTATACRAFQMDDHTYEINHVSPDCACDKVWASQAQLSRILNSGANTIPLIVPFAIDVDSGSRQHCRLVNSASCKEYVAISHVWSDGLGNPYANAIPRCQFDRLSALTSQLYGGERKPFWLDTLCFPLEPQDAYDLALIRMRQSYESADRVLVLDRSIFTLDASVMTTHELLTRVLCSPWNHRLWTLQEGFLAKSLYFQAANGAVNFSETDFIRSWHRKADLSYMTVTHVFIYYDELRASERGPEYTFHNMTALSAKSALTTRSTSVAEDEALCLGNLLGLDAETIVRTPQHERMRKVWTLQSDHYVDILFWPGPKLKDKGFRWAPATLLGYPKRHTSWPRTRATLTAEGLAVKLPGVLLKVPWKTIRTTFALKDQYGNWCMVKVACDLNGNEEKGSYLHPCWEVGRADENCQLALITKDAPFPGGTPSLKMSSPAVLATVQELESDYIRVNMICYVNVQEASQEDSRRLNMLREREMVRDGPGTTSASSSLGTSNSDRFSTDRSRLFFDGHKTALDQLWHVD